MVKGGLIIDLGVRGFLPASLVDIRRVPNLRRVPGPRRSSAKVIELNRSRNNVVLSRRAVLEEERKEQRQQILDRLQPGLVVEGQISNIVDFGAFVDLDGIDGLIHISELSWSHVNHPSEILNIGDTVKVKVLDIDRDRQRISLGLKQTQEDPWQRVVDTYNVGDELEGKVTKVVTFGAFVEILDGVEGLVHISELAAHHVENPREIVHPGDEISVKVLEIDSERRRLSLSAKRVEGQILPVRARGPSRAPRRRASPDRGAAAEEAAARRAARGRRRRAIAGDVPELGLSEDVLRRAPPRRLRPPAEPPTEASAGRAPAPAPADPDAAECAQRVTPVPFVGLTGGVGAGKSTALAELERLGAATLSTDAVVHELYASDDVRDAVVERFGADVAPDGAVDRAALAAARVRDARGPGLARGHAVAPVGARIAAWRAEQAARDPAPRRHGCRGAAAVRGRHGGRLRRDHRRGRRRGRARAARRRARARGRRRAGRAPASPGREGPARRPRRRATTGPSTTCTETCRRFLRC